MPAPYMVERFNAVADRGKLDFEAWFNERVASDRSWDVDETAWRFPFRYIPAVTLGRWRFRFPFPLLFAPRPDVLVSLYAEPSFLIGWGIAHVRRIRKAFWVEVTFDRWVRRRFWKEALKRLLFSRVDGVLTVGQDGRRFARRYNAPDDRIFFARHSVDVVHFSAQRSALVGRRDRIRSQIGVHGVTFIYVGRLWSGKGLNILLKAYELLQKKRGIECEVSLLIVGDGVQEPELRKRVTERGLKNVVFAGFKQKQELPHYYCAADVFVFPTLGDPYGMVVDEAMASSLPVISTLEAGEIHERVDDGVNGFLVPAEDAEALADKMVALVHDPAARTRMGEASFQMIKEHTPERWAADFEAAIARILGQPSVPERPRLL